MNAEAQKIQVTVKDMPDGSVRAIFVLSPGGQILGIVTAEAANADSMAMIAANFAQVVQQRRSAVQVAGAGTLSQLDAASRGTRAANGS